MARKKGEHRRDNLKAICTHVPRELHARLEALADREGTTIDYCTRKAIKMALPHLEREAALPPPIVGTGAGAGTGAR